MSSNKEVSDERAAQQEETLSKKEPVPFQIVNQEVEFDREHARALVELLLPEIKERMDTEQLNRVG